MATDQADFERKRLDTVMENLAKEDGLIDDAGNWLHQAPHCDALVLHAPGTCTFCDKYPDRQNARIARRVAFTGEGYHPTKTRCPSEYFRPADTIHLWERNRPTITPDNFKVITDEVEVVEAIPFDDNTETVIDFSQVVSHLGGLIASLKQVMSSEKFALHGNSIAEANLSSAEALLEILRSDVHPPLFIEPGPNESVIVAYTPNVHDLATEIDPPGHDGKVVAYFRPEMVEDDATSEQSFPELPFTITVNGKEHLIKGSEASQPISYHTIVNIVKEDRGEHEYRDDVVFIVKYEGVNSKGTLRPGQAIHLEPGMIFRATVTGDA